MIDTNLMTTILLHTAIASFGLLAVFYNNRENYKAPLFGFIFIVLTIYSCIISQQWGILVLCIVYMYAWSKELFLRLTSNKKSQLGWSYDEFIDTDGIQQDTIQQDILDELHKAKRNQRPRITMGKINE